MNTAALLTAWYSLLLAAGLVHFGVVDYDTSKCPYNEDQNIRVCERVLDDGEPITGKTVNWISGEPIEWFKKD